MNGYDIDGVLTKGIIPKHPCVIISGRTLAEYDNNVKLLAQFCPVYIRCIGDFGDREAAGKWKAEIISLLKIETFYEDDPIQMNLILEKNPTCNVVLIK
jgi:hypothetical protein